LWDFTAPDPDQLYRWRVQLDCGCIEELFTFDKEKLPTESTYRGDHLYHSQLQPGQVGCANDEHTRPQPYREIVEWGERREQTFLADPVESRYDDIDQELWAKIRHDAPHTSAFWMVTLSCGHRSEVCTDVDWKPEGRTSPRKVRMGAGDDQGVRGILGLAFWRGTRTGTRARPAHAGTGLAPPSARDAVFCLQLGPADRCLRTCGMAHPETETKTKLAQTTIQGELAASSPRGRATGHAATRTARPTPPEARPG